jgi:hypothetical protein
VSTYWGKRYILWVSTLYNSLVTYMLVLLVCSINDYLDYIDPNKVDGSLGAVFFSFIFAVAVAVLTGYLTH